MFAEVDALSDLELMSINVDLGYVVFALSAPAQRVSPYRQLATSLPCFEVSSFEKLGDCVCVLIRAHGEYGIVVAPDNDKPEVNAERIKQHRDGFSRSIFRTT